jgi:hypothetical protein
MLPQKRKVNSLMNLHPGIAADPHFSRIEQRIHALPGDL